MANVFAVMTEKLKYDGFGELQEAVSAMWRHSGKELRLGKSDFKSAFKTLYVSEDQEWLCHALVFNPETQKWQVVQLLSQTFGSLGGVVAWHRIAKAIQTIRPLIGLRLISK